MEGIVFQMLVDSWQLYDNSGISAVLILKANGVSIASDIGPVREN